METDQVQVHKSNSIGPGTYYILDSCYWQLLITFSYMVLFYHHNCSVESIAIITFLLMEPQEGCLICRILHVLVSLEINLPVITRNMKGIINVYSCVCLLSLSKMFLRLTHGLVICSHHLLFFNWVVFLCLNLPQFAHLFTCWWIFGLFHVWGLLKLLWVFRAKLFCW